MKRRYAGQKLRVKETSLEVAQREEILELRMENKRLQKFNRLLMEKNEVLEKQLVFLQNKQFVSGCKVY
jgi:hypothetical protein